MFSSLWYKTYLRTRTRKLVVETSQLSDWIADIEDSASMQRQSVIENSQLILSVDFPAMVRQKKYIATRLLCFELWEDIGVKLLTMGAMLEGVDTSVCKIWIATLTNHVSSFSPEVSSEVIKNTVGPGHQPRTEEALSNSDKGVWSTLMSLMFSSLNKCSVLKLLCENNHFVDYITCNVLQMVLCFIYVKFISVSLMQLQVFHWQVS